MTTGAANWPRKKLQHSGLIPSMSPNRSCSICGQVAEFATCPNCGNETEKPDITTGNDAERETSLQSTTHSDLESSNDLLDDELNDVVYLSETDDGNAKGGKKFIRTLIGLLYFYGIPVMCIALAVANRLRIVFIFGAVFGVQLAYLHFRNK